MTTLHSGGKFEGKAYSTSGGLHGVGVSVVNALSTETIVEVARDKTLYRQSFSKGLATSKLQEIGAAPNRRGTTVAFTPDPEIFGADARFSPERLYTLARSKAYLFAGVEIRWRCDPSLTSADVPESATFQFPGGLADHLAEQIGDRPAVTNPPFVGKQDFPSADGASQGSADLFELGCGEAFREGLAVELLVAGDLDDRLGRERVDDADADAVEAAGGAVRLAFELSARVEGGHDDFERRLARRFGVRVDRDAAAVVEDGQAVAGLQRDFDAAGVAGDRFVHRIVDDLGGEVVERAGVGAADVHAGAAADGLQAFEDLDRGSVVAFGYGRCGVGSEQVGHVGTAIGP